MSLPSFNIFILQPPKGESKKSSPLIDALRKKKEDVKHIEMLQGMKNIANQVENLPHTGHSGGG